MEPDPGFALTKILASASSPFFLLVVVLAVAAACLWVPRTVRAARVVVSAAAIALFLVGWAPIADRLLRVHEFRHEAVLDVATLPDSAWVVVLGGGVTSDPRLPPTAWLNGSSLARVVEGVRLHRVIPGSTLVVSGGAVSDTISTASVMATMAVALGVEPETMVVEARPRNTAEEADRVVAIAAGRPVVLVTSASHMPRAVSLFRGRGLEVVPAPTHYLAAERMAERLCVRRLVPSATNVRKVERAVYEWLARLRPGS